MAYFTAEYIGSDLINKLKIIKMTLGSPDESGRRKPEPIPGSEINLDVDLIIEALGFEPENIPNCSINLSWKLLNGVLLKLTIKI